MQDQRSARARSLVGLSKLIWSPAPTATPSSPQITSTKNPLVKRFQALARREAREAQGLFVVEGARMIEEVLAAPARVEVLLYDPRAAGGRYEAAILERARQQGARLVTASPHVVAACSHVETPQGMVAVVERPRAAIPETLSAPDGLVVVADRLQDPGNLGTIIRIADAVGATAVLITHGTVDPYNPKAVRATMGSLFHLPVITIETADAVTMLHRSGVRVLVADQSGTIDYDTADYRAPVAIVLGSEGAGPDAAWRDVADGLVRIPLYGRAESLNVAVAAGVLLYEARRAWRAHSRGRPSPGVDA